MEMLKHDTVPLSRNLQTERIPDMETSTRKNRKSNSASCRARNYRRLLQHKFLKACNRLPFFEIHDKDLFDILDYNLKHSPEKPSMQDCSTQTDFIEQQEDMSSHVESLDITSPHVGTAAATIPSPATASVSTPVCSNPPTCALDPEPISNDTVLHETDEYSNTSASPPSFSIEPSITQTSYLQDPQQPLSFPEKEIPDVAQVQQSQHSTHVQQQVCVEPSDEFLESCSLSDLEIITAEQLVDRRIDMCYQVRKQGNSPDPYLLITYYDDNDDSQRYYNWILKTEIDESDFRWFSFFCNKEFTDNFLFLWTTLNK